MIFIYNLGIIFNYMIIYLNYFRDLSNFGTDFSIKKKYYNYFDWFNCKLQLDISGNKKNKRGEFSVKQKSRRGERLGCEDSWDHLKI